MGTRRVKLTGLVYWAKVFPENRDLTGYEDALKGEGGQTLIDIDLDEANVEKVKKSKSMKKPKQSPDNPELTRYRFNRKWTGNFEDNADGGPPKVLKEDGSEWDFDEDGPIGNGSEAMIVLSVYDTSRKNIVGTRLEKVKITKHIPYDPDDDSDEEDANKEFEEEDEKPAPKKASSKKKQQEEQDDDTEDEIPF